jgi:endoglucanase
MEARKPMVKLGSSYPFLALWGVCWVGCGGGAAATGGAAPPTAKPAESTASAPASSKACPDGTIDDAEDNDGKILTLKDRGGYWFTYADDSGSTIEPMKFAMAAGGANGSKYAARMTGKMGTKGDSVWAGMGFNFSDPKKPYNATAYKGVSFMAKIGAGSTEKVRITVADMNTDPEGKVCREKGCYNHFGSDLSLTDKWAKYTILFSAMTQQSGWGDPHPPSIDASKIFAMQWAESTAGASFDVWIDDIQFVCE